MLQIGLMQEGDWPLVAAIYREGIATGNATFATEPPASWAAWSAGTINACSIVIRNDQSIFGWAAVSPTSSRACYAGVVEHSVYVAEVARGQGIGSQLLQELIRVTEAQGIWTIQSSIFPENEWGALRRGALWRRERSRDARATGTPGRTLRADALWEHQRGARIFPG